MIDKETEIGSCMQARERERRKKKFNERRRVMSEIKNED
jgi:hypothetical protein